MGLSGLSDTSGFLNNGQGPISLLISFRALLGFEVGPFKFSKGFKRLSDPLLCVSGLKRTGKEIRKGNSLCASRICLAGLMILVKENNSSYPIRERGVVFFLSTEEQVAVEASVAMAMFKRNGGGFLCGK